jgi:hypothetical protein
LRAYSGSRRRLIWLGLTPDPERLLPGQVAALRQASSGEPSEQTSEQPSMQTSGQPSMEAAEQAERRRVERLVMHGTQRRWIAYLGEVTDLVHRVATGAAPGDRRIALEVADVVRHHHRMLIGLPGPGYAQVAGQRADLDLAIELLEGR